MRDIGELALQFACWDCEQICPLEFWCEGFAQYRPFAVTALRKGSSLVLPVTWRTHMCVCVTTGKGADGVLASISASYFVLCASYIILSFTRVKICRADLSCSMPVKRIAGLQQETKGKKRKVCSVQCEV